MSKYRKVGQTARAIGAGLLILISGCAANHKSSIGLTNRPLPVRVFVQRDTINDICIQSKADNVILEEFIWTEQFCPQLNLQFNILDWYYFNNIDNIIEHDLASYYSDSVNIFYYFPVMNGVSGYADFPYEFPATIKIYGSEYDPKLLTHELFHQLGNLKHVHKDSSDFCYSDGCSDTAEINLSIDEMNDYPNIMTYSRSDYYFITQQQIERIKLWYKIRFIHKVYGPELTNPIDNQLVN